MIAPTINTILDHFFFPASSIISKIGLIQIIIIAKIIFSTEIPIALNNLFV